MNYNLPPHSPSLSELSFGLNGDKVKSEMIFYFSIFKSSFFFLPIARNVLNVKAQVSVFFTTLLVDWPHHQYYITDIKSDPRGSYSNWRVSEKRNSVTLGQAGYIDDELTVYNSVRVKGGMSLRNGTWQRNDIIMRNLIYAAEWSKEIN